MKFLVVLAFIGAASAQNQYIWDLLNPALNAAEVQAILISAKAGSDYPNYDQIPQTNFDCSSKKQSGFYADVDTKCQVFHRCDINGNLTSYLCVNTTVFNQLTLVCDYYFNVDCSKAQSFENFANSRLYQGENVQLFDTPPADYQTPQQKQQAADAEVIAAGGQAPSNNNNNKKPAPKPAPSNGKKGATTKRPTGTTKPSIQNRSDTGDNTINQVQPGRNLPAKPFRGVTPKAPIRATTTTTTAASSEASSEDTTAISSEETSAASSEDTSAASSEATSASGEDTTAASSDETSAASSEDTTAVSGDDTTAASSDETSAASSEDTTAVAGGDESTASSEAGSDSTAAGGEDTTTASA